jgi:hypothetical protein
VDEGIAANPKQVEQVKAKPQTLGWFVGQVMKATGGKANPTAVNEILRKKLAVADSCRICWRAKKFWMNAPLLWLHEDFGKI